MKIISRKEAIKSGLKYYYTGKSCKHGHVDKRYYLGGNCYSCLKINANKKTESSKKRRKNWVENNKEKISGYNKSWITKNREVKNEHTAKRRALQLSRIPKWVDKEERFLIQESYALAQLRSKVTGFKWHVDHIIPLSNSKVCGLHVIENIQVIPAIANLVKNNKFEIGGTCETTVRV